MRFIALLALAVGPWMASSTPTKNEPRDTKPVLDLSYGSFEATSKSSGIWTFKNIPYAAPPLGDLRWAKPAPPLKKNAKQSGSRKGAACLQSGVYGLNVVGDMNDDPMGQAINQILGSSEALAGLNVAQSEDCLFLDIQIPEKAIKNPSLKLPVVVYVYGGGYALGSKDLLQPLLPLYDGSGLIEQSGNNIIFVSFNYRVGALGFLAGTTMENEGLPNAGLWDQRAVFQWVQTHISKLGGDPRQVTALGESAGASSLLFHLVAEGGTLDPLFRRAVLLSPAYQPMWDRAGSIEDQFQRFASLAGCEGKGLKCLRAADTKALNKANIELVKQKAPGTFAVGPTPDGSFIRQIPTAELSLGKIWPIESLVLSHCEKEAVLFVSGAVKTNAQFEDFLSVLLPNSSIANGITERVLEAYPSIGSKGSPYKKQSDRLEALIRDSSMTCSIRYITEALGADKVWNMQYGVAPGWHATDLIPVFYNDKDFDMSSFTDFLASALSLITGLFMGALSRAYQSYLTSYIRTGDPNTYRISRWQNKLFPGTEQWRRPELTSEGMKKVLNVDYGLLKYFSEVHDKQFPDDKCDFWKEFAKAGTVAGGYVPDGEVLEQDWVDDAKASDNYGGGQL